LEQNVKPNNTRANATDKAVGSPQVKKLSGRGLGNLRVTDLLLLAFATRFGIQKTKV
jgi:hypothetical protein